MLGCSASTIKQQLSRLLERFDVTNRTELAAVAASWSSTATPVPQRAIYTR
jgi:DNA-binding CsgD family transcriptional regulator